MRIANPIKPNQAPRVSAREWVNTRNELSLEALRGRPVVIAWWGMKCGVCQCVPVVRKLASLHKKHERQGLVVMALHVHEGSQSLVDAFCLKRECH